MENKNKKEMSVDDLVKQLKLVLDIDEEEENASPAPQPEKEKAETEEPKETKTEPLTVDNAETISDKVKLLDRFFEEEENKNNKKKNRIKTKKEKKKKQVQYEQITAFDGEENLSGLDELIDSHTKEREEKKNQSDDENLSTFADEINAMFSDPETEETDAEPTVVIDPISKSEAVTEPETIAETEPGSEAVSDVGTVSEPEPEEKPEEPEAEETEPEDIITRVTKIEPEELHESDGLADTVDLSPFIYDALSKEQEDKPEEDGETRQFSYKDAEQDEGKTRQFSQIDEKEPETEPEQEQEQEPEPSVLEEQTDDNPPIADAPSDIDGFDVIFDDIHKESEDGYTAAEEAIMDTFAEKQEKPKKNPVKTFSDFSANDRTDEEEEKEEKEDRNAGKYDEFIAYDQRKTFLETFKKKFVSLRTSLIFSSIFAVLVFAYECLSFFGDKFPYFCSPESNPAVFILIDLQLFALCAIFSVTHLIDGLKGVFSGKANIASIAALSTLITFVYGILSAVTGAPVPHPVMSASALCIIMMLAAKIRYVKRDTLNFRIISGTAAKPKFVMEAYVPGKNSPEEKEFYDYIPENAKMLRISKTEFVKGFIGSNMKPSSSTKYVNIMFPVLALIFAGVLAVVLIVKKDMSSAVNAAYISSALCTPAALFAAVTLPSFCCAKKTYDDDCCIVSEAAAEEYADASVVTFEDSDVFPPSLDKITSVRLYNDSRMDHIMYVLTSLFRKIGGPLLTICENAAREYNEFSNNVVIDNAVENGIEATVDSQKVFLGSSTYMGSKLDPKYCIDDRQYAENDKSRIMYMIINDVVTAKFYIEYEMDKDFLSVIKQLSTSTRCVAIRTLDPNIDTKLIKSYLDTEIYHCKIMRTRENERRKTVSASSRGAIVSKNSIKALLRSLMLCDKMVYSAKINMIICFLSVVIGLIFGIFLTATKTLGSVSALHVLAYQILLSIVIWIVTKINT